MNAKPQGPLPDGIIPDGPTFDIPAPDTPTPDTMDDESMIDRDPPGEQDKRTNLGRGLAALFGEEGEDYASLDKVRTTKEVPIERIHPNHKQPRRYFDDKAIEALAESIKANGILQPILVRRHPERASDFEIVAGERRWRAAQLAKLHQVPVVIKELSDAQALEVALVENVQRQDLTPIEEAEGYRRLINEFDHTQEKLAESVGKSRSHIANTLRLLSLPEDVKKLLGEGALTAGHARALLGAQDPGALAKHIISGNFSVRQAENLARSTKWKEGAKKDATAPSATKPAKDPDTVALERDLSALLGLKVKINFHGEGGSLVVHYRTIEQLDDVLRRLSHSPPKDA